MSISTQVRDYIEEFVLYGDHLESDDASLIESGVIDSTGAMELVMFIEETFDTTVPSEDINPDNLDTVNSITSLITRLTGALTIETD